MSITTRLFLATTILLSISSYAQAQKNWKEITSVEDLCESYPETIKTMLDHYDLDHPGLNKVKVASNTGNIVEVPQGTSRTLEWELGISNYFFGAVSPSISGGSTTFECDGNTSVSLVNAEMLEAGGSPPASRRICMLVIKDLALKL